MALYVHVWVQILELGFSRFQLMQTVDKVLVDSLVVRERLDCLDRDTFKAQSFTQQKASPVFLDENYFVEVKLKVLVAVQVLNVLVLFLSFVFNFMFQLSQRVGCIHIKNQPVTFKLKRLLCLNEVINKNLCNLIFYQWNLKCNFKFLSTV